MKLEELHKAATPGPWDMVEDCFNGAVGAHGSWHSVGPLYLRDPVIKDDDKLVAYLRNHAADIIALVKAAERVCSGSCDHIYINNIPITGELKEAIAPFLEKS